VPRGLRWGQPLYRVGTGRDVHARSWHVELPTHPRGGCRSCRPRRPISVTTTILRPRPPAVASASRQPLQTRRPPPRTHAY